MVGRVSRICFRGDNTFHSTIDPRYSSKSRPSRPDDPDCRNSNQQTSVERNPKPSFSCGRSSSWNGRGRNVITDSPGVTYSHPNSVNCLLKRIYTCKGSLCEQQRRIHRKSVRRTFSDSSFTKFVEIEDEYSRSNTSRGTKFRYASSTITAWVQSIPISDVFYWLTHCQYGRSPGCSSDV